MSEIEEIKKILRRHEERISKLEKIISEKPTKFKKDKKKMSINDLFIEIKGEGFFDKPRFREDIVKKLEETGNIYNGDSLNWPLMKAVKTRILGRKKIDGKYGYVRR